MALVLTVNFFVSTLKAIGKAVFRRNKQKQPLRIQEQIGRRKLTSFSSLVRQGNTPTRVNANIKSSIEN